MVEFLYNGMLLYIFSELSIERSVGSLKSAVVGVFTPWKLANTTNQGAVVIVIVVSWRADC